MVNKPFTNILNIRDKGLIKTTFELPGLRKFFSSVTLCYHLNLEGRPLQAIKSAGINVSKSLTKGTMSHSLISHLNFTKSLIKGSTIIHSSL